MPADAARVKDSPAFLARLAESCAEDEVIEFFDSAGGRTRPGLPERADLAPQPDDWNIGFLIRPVAFPDLAPRGDPRRIGFQHCVGGQIDGERYLAVDERDGDGAGGDEVAQEWAGCPGGGSRVASAGRRCPLREQVSRVAPERRADLDLEALAEAGGRDADKATQADLVARVTRSKGAAGLLVLNGAIEREPQTWPALVDAAAIPELGCDATGAPWGVALHGGQRVRAGRLEDNGRCWEMPASLRALRRSRQRDFRGESMPLLAAGVAGAHRVATGPVGASCSGGSAHSAEPLTLALGIPPSGAAILFRRPVAPPRNVSAGLSGAEKKGDRGPRVIMRWRLRNALDMSLRDALRECAFAARLPRQSTRLPWALAPAARDWLFHLEIDRPNLASLQRFTGLFPPKGGCMWVSADDAEDLFYPLQWPGAGAQETALGFASTAGPLSCWGGVPLRGGLTPPVRLRRDRLSWQIQRCLRSAGCPGGCAQKLPFRLPARSLSLVAAMEQVIPGKLAERIREDVEERAGDDDVCLGGFKAWQEVAANRNVIFGSRVGVKQGTPGIIIGNFTDGFHVTVKFDEREDGSELCVNLLPEALMAPLPGGFRLGQRVVALYDLLLNEEVGVRVGTAGAIVGSCAPLLVSLLYFVWVLVPVVLGSFDLPCRDTEVER
ncbi:unnamed protein product [Prorocentrum cordatum]|uniref:RNA-directed RNA polymerase n=1 Tax=Prorocentrum cordatum TaxID=2364126 RepID=A0ABN9VEB4_9DINO|nr:unnamed protein product [Polarella glacialis]